MNTLEATFLVQSSSNLLRMIILTISQLSSNMGDVGSKTRSVGQIMEKPCEHSRGHLSQVLVQSSSNLLRMIILTISQSSSNMGDKLEKPCEKTRSNL